MVITGISPVETQPVKSHFRLTFQAQDPFWEPLETPTLIGVAYVPTECIAYMLDIQDQKVGIYDYESCLVGYLTVSLVPCAEDGHDCGEDRAVEEPIDLVSDLNCVYK